MRQTVLPRLWRTARLCLFFYEHPEEYRQHLTHEGELKPEERAWQTANNTYAFSDGLGVVELIIAALVLANPVSRWLGLAGGVLAFLTPFVTLSFFNHHAGGLGYAAGRCALWFFRIYRAPGGWY
ncbi:Putative inner membrane protein [Salmonella sp. NCTC 11881]|nr:Putative inner membrane protein [Salmonella sp. NCTC 11881]